MNKPPLATNMHLCCRDANHKHLYLLVNAGTKSGDAKGGEQKKRGEEGKGEENRRRWRNSSVSQPVNERVAVSVVQNHVEAICLMHFS